MAELHEMHATVRHRLAERESMRQRIRPARPEAWEWVAARPLAPAREP